MDYDIASKFSEIESQVSTILKLSPLEPRFKNVRWCDIPFNLDNRRFGVSEVLNPDNTSELLVAKELLHSANHLIDWVLWREAILQHLCYRVRSVPEIADLGLYGGLKYGVKRHRVRQKLQLIWETVSIPQEYESYQYNPTAGFHFFDKIVDGTFLQKVIPWLNACFCGVSFPLTTQAFTTALERWMFDYHRVLDSTQIRILIALAEQPVISQEELAKRVRLTQPSVSKALRKMADRHLLRLVGYVNLPLIGLQRVAVAFHSTDSRVLWVLRRALAKIRYTLLIWEFSDAIFCTFAIPFRRIGRFREWVTGLAAAWNLPYPEIRTVIQHVQHRNFTLYKPEEGGWPQDYEPILENVFRLVREEISSLLPPIQTVQYSTLTPPTRVKLQPADFVYMRRATSSFFLTDRVASTEAQEARLAGYREGEHGPYRRRVRVLEKLGLLSPPLGVGLIIIGLNAVISLLVKASHEESAQLLTSLQLMPHIAGAIYNDGCATAALLVPKEASVAIVTSLQEQLHECGINALTMVKPAWETYGWTFQPPVSLRNYDFDRGAWVWAKDTLPVIKHPDI